MRASQANAKPFSAVAKLVRGPVKIVPAAIQKAPGSPVGPLSERQLVTRPTVAPCVGRQRQSRCFFGNADQHPRWTGEQVTHRCRRVPLASILWKIIIYDTTLARIQFQCAIARKARLPLQHARQLLFGNRPLISLERTCQLRQPDTGFRGAKGFFEKTCRLAGTQE
jgi:hypothetical protein